MVDSSPQVGCSAAHDGRHDLVAHNVKLSDDQWQKIRELATVEKRSIANLVSVLLEEALMERKSPRK
jgi:hypothetical protein